MELGAAFFTGLALVGIGVLCMRGFFTLQPNEAAVVVFFGSYAGDVSGQGIVVARMKWGDRRAPGGRVWKRHADGWTEPGIGGRVTGERLGVGGRG